MSPFIPQGERARWRIIYDLLVKAETGDVITYQAMAEALGLHPDADRHKIQMDMRRAAKEHLENDLRSVAAVPNEGYKVIETPQKLELARQHQAKAVRSVRRGRAHVSYADLSGVNEATRAVFEAMAWKFTQQDEMIHRLDVRQQRHERQLNAAVSAQGETSQQLADLRERLARLEAGQQDLKMWPGSAGCGAARRGKVGHGLAGLGLDGRVTGSHSGSRPGHPRDAAWPG